MVSEASRDLIALPDRVVINCWYRAGQSLAIEDLDESLAIEDLDESLAIEDLDEVFDDVPERLTRGVGP